MTKGDFYGYFTQHPTPNTQHPTPIIIFGAGTGGKILTKEIEDYSYEVIAYADNNEKKHGTKLFGKPIIFPNEILKFNYDQIFIASIDAENIAYQLTTECGIPVDKINKTLFSRVSYRARVTALKNAAQLVYKENIQGSVAELGVYKGEFAKHINELFSDRNLFLFDTFEGFSNIDIKVENEIGVDRSSQKSTFSDTNIDLVLKKMKSPERCIIKKGFFPETAKDIEEQFALVSLDADLYEPMLEGLKYFYPRVSKGGFIFIHDYFSETWNGTQQAVIEYKNKMDIHFVPIGDDCSVVVIKK